MSDSIDQAPVTALAETESLKDQIDALNAKITALDAEINKPSAAARLRAGTKALFVGLGHFLAKKDSATARSIRTALQGAAAVFLGWIAVSVLPFVQVAVVSWLTRHLPEVAAYGGLLAGLIALLMNQVEALISKLRLRLMSNGTEDTQPQAL